MTNCPIYVTQANHCPHAASVIRTFIAKCWAIIANSSSLEREKNKYGKTQGTARSSWPWITSPSGPQHLPSQIRVPLTVPVPVWGTRWAAQWSKTELWGLSVGRGLSVTPPSPTKWWTGGAFQSHPGSPSLSSSTSGTGLPLVVWWSGHHVHVLLKLCAKFDSHYYISRSHVWKPQFILEQLL